MISALTSSLTSPQNTAPELQLLVFIDRAVRQWEVASQRLATGLRINSPADDPAGYIAAAEQQSEITGLTRATSNVQKMDGLLDLADSAMSNIGESLSNLQAEVLKGERANASQIRSILGSIDFLGRAAQYQGTKLFSGESMIYTSQTSAQGNAKIASSQVHQISSQNIGETFTLNVVADAKKGRVVANFGDTGTGIAADAKISISGSYDISETLSLTAGMTNSDIAALVNGQTTRTGLTASVDTATKTIVFETLGVGSDQAAVVQVRDGNVTFTDGTNGYAKGTDVVAQLGGRNVSAQGRTLTIATSEINAKMRLDPVTPAGIAAGKIDFTVTGRGRTFQLGSDVVSSQQMTISLPHISTYDLGNQYGVLADLAEIDWSDAVAARRGAEIVSGAIEQLATQRGVVGTLQKNTVAPMKTTLQAMTDVITDERNRIIGVDVAAETSVKSRSAILMQAGMFALSDIHSLRASLIATLM
ncbi:MAG: flagellin [Thermoguttaceae bacterium]